MAYATTKDLDLKVPKDLKTSSDASNRIKLQWERVKGAEAYYVYYSFDKNGSYKPYKNANGQIAGYKWSPGYSFTTFDLSPETEMYFKVEAVRGNEISEKSKEIKSVSKEVGIPSSVEALGISNSVIQISWERVKGADYYYIYTSEKEDGIYTTWKDSNGYRRKVLWSEDYCMRINRYEPETKMYFKVTAVKNGVESEYGDIVSAKTLKRSMVIFEEVLDVYANDGTYLDKLINDLKDPESIFNEEGDYENKEKVNNIWNKTSEYGSEDSDMSSFNEGAKNPPKAYYNGAFIMYITENPNIDNGLNLYKIKEILTNTNESE